MAVQTFGRNQTYTDLDLEFTRNRVTNDVDILEGVDAIKASIKNLIRMDFYDIPFKPSIGSPVRKLLFDNVTPITAIMIKDTITNTITNFETRVNLISVIVEPHEDENRYKIMLICQALNNPEPVIITMFLERVR